MDAYELQLVKEAMRLISDAHVEVEQGLLSLAKDRLVDAMSQLEQLTG